MDEKPSTENPVKKDFNKLDLSQLQGFSFGTQWAQEKPEPHGRADGREGAQRRNPERREREPHGAHPGGIPSRDRRSFRKPAGGGGPGSVSQEGSGEDATRGSGHGHREDGHARDSREFRGGPRREAGGPGNLRAERRGGHGERGGERGSRFGGREGGHGGSRHEDRGPYISPHFTVTFYPEDASFAALAKTIRSSCRTFELFDIAKTVIGKPERFVVVLTRKSPDSAPAAGQLAAAPTSGGKSGPMAISVPDGIPFENEESAIAHALDKHLGSFFDVAEVEVDPPKGNFLIVNRCGITGELLGPPNYHRYNQILQQHFASRIKGMSLEAFRSRVESVRDPEVVNQWLEKMKKATRYTWKQGAAPLADGQQPSPVVAFDSFEEARTHLLSQARDKVVKLVDNARFHGVLVGAIPPGEIRRSIDGALERQRRFPLDTANALRGRLRREGFTIFKKGSKGISYVCAVKRKFRIPGQTFSESIGNLIAYIEANPMVKAGDLPRKLLGLAIVTPPSAPVAPQTEGATVSAPLLSAEDQNRLSRMQGDLRWLVTEGYVTEFLDGRLFAPPAMVEARKKEIESAEHDPENFPEAPASVPVEATVPGDPQVEANPSPEETGTGEGTTTRPEEGNSASAPVPPPPAMEEVSTGTGSETPQSAHDPVI